MNQSEGKPIKRQIPRHLGFVLLFSDIFALFGAFLTTKYVSALLVNLSAKYDWSYEFHHFDTRRYYYYFLGFFVVLRFVLKGHYSRRVPWLAQVETIFKTIIFAALFDCFNFYFLDYNSFPILILSNWGLAIGFILIARYISLHIVSSSPKWKLPIVLVGDNRMAMDSLYAFYADGQTGYEVKAALLTYEDPNFDRNFLPKEHPSIFWSTDVDEFDKFIKENRQYYYIFGMDELCGPYKDRFISALNESQVEYGVIPNTKNLDVHGMEPHYFFGNDIMLLHRRDPIRSPSGVFLKRMVDVGVSLICLPVLALLAVVVYIAKKNATSNAPVFYGGVRVGRKGKLFNCWKFCTMRADADEILKDILKNDERARDEWDKFQKLKNDPRVDSKISAFLRKTSLDELPQLWNVLRGDMSLVGPRPLLPAQLGDYERIEEYLAVRPGLTGLWQVSGRNDTSFQQRVYWDGWYIRNWSLWYDTVILFKTVRVLTRRSGAY